MAIALGMARHAAWKSQVVLVEDCVAVVLANRAVLAVVCAKLALLTSRAAHLRRSLSLSKPILVPP